MRAFCMGLGFTAMLLVMPLSFVAIITGSDGVGLVALACFCFGFPLAMLAMVLSP